MSDIPYFTLDPDFETFSIFDMDNKKIELYDIYEHFIRGLVSEEHPEYVYLSGCINGYSSRGILYRRIEGERDIYERVEE